MGQSGTSAWLLGLLARSAAAQNGRAVDIGCGCGAKNTSSGGGAYIWVDENGVGTEFPTEIEAKAAKIRGGGGGFVKAV